MCLYLGTSCISRVNIYISSQFMHISGEYIYIEIYGIHTYCRRISLCLANSCILQPNISISSKFMHMAGEYIYIYIYIEFIHIVGEYLYT